MRRPAADVEQPTGALARLAAELPSGRQAGIISSWEGTLAILASATRRRLAAEIEAYEEAASLCRTAAAPRGDAILKEAQQNQLQPSRALYEGAVVAAGAMRQWETALAYLVEARTSGAGLSSLMLDGFLEACASVETWQNAWPQALMLLVDACPRWGLVPSAEHFALTLRSLRGPTSWVSATQLLDEMRMLGLQTTSSFYDGIACAFASRWTDALTLLLEARQQGVRAAVHQTVENLATEARRGAEAFRPFWDVAPAQKSLMAKWSHALDLFFRHLTHQTTPRTLDDYRAVIKACPRFYWKLSLALLEEMNAAALGPDLLSYREAMRTCNRGLYSYNSVLLLFQDLRDCGLEPGLEEYNEVMMALVTGNRWKEAFDLFQQMRTKDAPRPDSMSYNIALYACADCDDSAAWSKALGYWVDMREDLITPGFDSYDMLLLVAERSNRFDWSRQLLDTLSKLDAPHTVTMFNAVLNAARRGKQWQLALTLLREMVDENLLPTVVSFSWAVDACEKANRVDVAKQLMEQCDALDAA